jgi:hypothetical protein
VNDHSGSGFPSTNPLEPVVLSPTPRRIGSLPLSTALNAFRHPLHSGSHNSLQIHGLREMPSTRQRSHPVATARQVLRPEP